MSLSSGYIVAEDNECVVVRYVLVYNDFGVRSTRKVNVCWVLAALYVLVLLLLWFTRSTTFKVAYSRMFPEY